MVMNVLRVKYLVQPNDVIIEKSTPKHWNKKTK